LIIALTLTLLTACQPAGSQPIFTSSVDTAITPIPFSAADPKTTVTIPGRIRSFNISLDMKTIALATSQGVVLYDIKSYKHLQTLNKTESFYLVDWSPDGKKLAAGGLIKGSTEFSKSHLVVWDTSTWEIIFEQTSAEDLWDSIYGDIAWSPDSQSLANGINGIGVLVYAIQTGKVISKQDTLSSHSISWSPDGSRLVATGDLASGIRRWKVSTGETVRLFDKQVGSSMQVAWSPDGKRIVSGGAEGTVCFWTAATNRCDGFIIKAHRNTVFSLAWSPDGNQLATGGGIIRIWDSNTGQLAKSFGMNDVSVYTHLEWLGSNQPLASVEVGYADTAPSIVHFWDVDTGELLFEFRGAEGTWGQ
jgi:WD40 repeat protein